MLIFSYLSRRFFAYVVIVSFLFAFLYNFIEFFEKLVRVKHATIAMIVHFLTLNFIPTFFDLLPVSIWLATCLVLKELFSRDEWELLQLLMFVPRGFFKFFGLMGIIASVLAILLLEIGGAHVALEAQQFKQEHFKHAATQKLVDGWFELSNNRFCHIGELDMVTQQGSHLLILTMTPEFVVEKIFTAPLFSINQISTTLVIPTGQIIDVASSRMRSVSNKVVASPLLMSQIYMGIEASTLLSCTYKVLFYRWLLPENVYAQLCRQLWNHYIYFLQLLLYPLFTVVLFYMMRWFPYGRWVAALGAYPISIIAHGFSTIIMQRTQNGWFVFFPYFILMALIFYIVVAAQKNDTLL